MYFLDNKDIKKKQPPYTTQKQLMVSIHSITSQRVVFTLTSNRYAAMQVLWSVVRSPW